MIAGEVIWAVPPLELPEPDTEHEHAALARFSSVRLFTMRAEASAPGFHLDDGNALAVAGLCRRLDGIPLALELAATRVRTLGVHELLARLDDRFRLLASGQRDAPRRQQTLWGVIDWSWELLTEPERVVLRRLAVMADGCGLRAAEAICGEDGLDVLALLSRLVDRSLVVVADRSNVPRYRLLESVAAYCLQLGLGETARKEGKLDCAEAHLRNVLRASRRTGSEPDVARVIALSELGFIGEQRGRPTLARAYHLRSLAAATKLGDSQAVAQALTGLAGVHAFADQTGRAARLLGAAETARRSAKASLPPGDSPDGQRITGLARQALGKAAFDDEFARGRRLRPAQAAALPVQ